MKAITVGMAIDQEEAKVLFSWARLGEELEDCMKREPHNMERTQDIIMALEKFSKCSQTMGFGMFASASKLLTEEPTGCLKVTLTVEQYSEGQ